MQPSVVVIGVGNPFRRDDGVGPAVIHRLRNRGVPDVTLVECDGEAAALVGLWDRRRLAFLVDAVHADPPHPGRVHRLVVRRPGAERARAAASHGRYLGDAVELARVTDHLPDRMIVLGVEVADVGFGRGLSRAVAAAADRITEEIILEIEADRRSAASDAFALA